jgi:hypothetical protein
MVMEDSTRTGNSMSENDLAAGAAGKTAPTDVDGGLEKVESNPDDDWSPEPRSCSSSPVSEDQQSAKRKREDKVSPKKGCLSLG